MEKLYEKCMELFKSDKECAQALGISVKYLYEVFEGRKNLKSSTIVKWCDKLNIPLTEAYKYFFTLTV